MATQADHAAQREVDPSWSEEEVPEQQERLPMEKSGVYVDPMANLVSRSEPVHYPTYLLTLTGRWALPSRTDCAHGHNT